MNISQISIGNNVPNEVNVIIEIPMRSEPVKYEIDKDSGALFVDRFMSTAMYYPANYGYVPQTLADDGDPLDILVLSPVPLMSGSVIPARPIGMLKMTDEAGIDTKILAVPNDKLTKIYRKYQSPDDVCEQTLTTIEHFFEHYKDLEEGKWVKVEGWLGPDHAKQEILDGAKAYKT